MHYEERWDENWRNEEEDDEEYWGDDEQVV